MKASILNIIIEQQQLIHSDIIIAAICNDGIKKFNSDKSLNIPDYVVRKLKHRKQDSYMWLLAIVKEITEKTGGDFESYFDNTEANYRDCHHKLEYH